MTKTIGNRLKQLRLDYKLSVEILAEIMEVKPRTIGAYERNENNPPIEFLLKLKYIFRERYDKNINLDYLISGEGSLFISDGIEIKTHDQLKEELKQEMREEGEKMAVELLRKHGLIK